MAPVDGGWSKWGPLVIVVDCSVTCGSGERKYELRRMCNNPPPSNGGKPCEGKAVLAAYQRCLKASCLKGRALRIGCTIPTVSECPSSGVSCEGCSIPTVPVCPISGGSCVLYYADSSCMPN